MGSDGRRKSGFTRVCLMVCVAVVVLERCHGIYAALDRDVAGYAVIGHEMLLGRNLYSDLWERKPPLLYGTFAAAEKLVGYGSQEIFLLNTFFTLIALAGIYFAGGAGGRGNIGGLCAAGFWAVLCGDMLLQADQPNGELFINAFVACAFALVVRLPRLRLRGAVLLGIFFAAATMYKHHAVVICLLIAVGHLFFNRDGSVEEDRRFSSRRAIDALIALSIIALAWAGLFAYFRGVGRLHAMVDVLFDQNSVYAGDVLGNLREGITLKLLFPVAMNWAIWPIILMVLAAAVAMLSERKKLAKHWKIWCCWAVGTWLTVSLPRSFYNHYYQLWLPVFCVAGGWAASKLIDRAKSYRVTGKVFILVIIVCYVGLIYREGRNYRLSQNEWMHEAYLPAMYFDNEFITQADLGMQLDRVLLPGEKFWNLGCENTLYFASHKSPPTGFLYLEPLERGPDVDEYWQRLMADLDRSRPDLVVITQRDLGLVPQSAAVFPWLSANYVQTKAADFLARPGFQIMVRRDGALLHRLEKFGGKSG